MSFSIRNTRNSEIEKPTWLETMDEDLLNLAQTDPNKVLVMIGGLNLQAQTKVNLIVYIFNSNTKILPSIATSIQTFNLKRKYVSQISREIIQLMSTFKVKVQPDTNLKTLLTHKNLRKKDFKAVCQNVSAEYYVEIGNTLRLQENESYFKKWHKWLYSNNTQLSDVEKKLIQDREAERILKDQADAISESGL